MPTRFLACLLAIAIAWISVFAFEAGHEQAHESSGDAAMVHVAAKDPGSVAEHHLDDVPLQAMDSATDLPDHQPPSRALIAAVAAPPLALSAHPPRYATVFLDGLLRPPGPPLFLS
jgi:hypothetical protein